MFKLLVKISTDVKCSILRICTEKRLLFVLILITLPFGLTSMDGKRRGCRVYTTSNVHVADCSLLEMSINVPNDLDPGIEVMNLSGNHLINISDRSFDRYKESLVSLDLSNMTHSFQSGNVTYDDKSFTGLRKLEYLDISHSCIVRHKFRFPSSLKVLKMENCELNSLNFSHIRALEELHAASCKLPDLPIIHKQSPLKFLDLRRNTLPKLRLETIAPFCQLKELRLEIPDGEGLQSPKMYCQCMLIATWLNDTAVKHDYLNCTKRDKNEKPPKLNINSEFDSSHYIQGFSVRKSETENITLDLYPKDPAKNQDCSTKPSESVMQLRRNCLEKITPHIITPVKTNWLLIGGAISAIFVLVIPTFIYFRRRVHRKRRRKRRKSQTDNQVPEEEHEEEAEEEVYHYQPAGYHEYEYGYGYYYQ